MLLIISDKCQHLLSVMWCVFVSGLYCCFSTTVKYHWVDCPPWISVPSWDQICNCSRYISVWHKKSPEVFWIPVLCSIWCSLCSVFQPVSNNFFSKLLQLQWIQSYPVLYTGHRCNRSPKTLWRCQTSSLLLCSPHILTWRSPTVPTRSHFKPFLCLHWTTAIQKVLSIIIPFVTNLILHWLMSLFTPCCRSNRSQTSFATTRTK